MNWPDSIDWYAMSANELNVGIVGAGIGGVLCSIANARAGGKVTILEAAQQLGEIGAGIQVVGDGRFVINESPRANDLHRRPTSPDF